MLIEAQHFAKGEAWKVAGGAHEALSHLRTAGGENSLALYYSLHAELFFA